MNSTIDIDGMRARYLTTGNGPDVVLLHGWGCRGDIWTGVQRHLGTSGFRVTSLDFPGFGGSVEPPAPWGMDDYAAWFEKFTAALGIDRPVLVGHSFGGRVAIVHAAHHAVSKMVLVDSAGVKPRRGPRYYAKVWTFKTLKHLSPLVLGHKKAEAIIERQRARAASADYLAASPVMRGTLSRVVGEDLRRHMSHIAAPTLLVWGSKDTATPLRDAKAMERLIPDAGLVVFEGAGHYSFLERAAQFAAVIDSFLRS